jgi:hypothetical protein
LGKAFVRDHGIVLNGRLAIVQTSFDDSARDPGFVLGELGIVGWAAEIGVVALRRVRGFQHDPGMVAWMTAAKL